MFLSFKIKMGGLGMNSLLKKVGMVLASSLLVVGLAGCGMSQQKTEKVAATKTPDKGAKKTYVVATRGTYRPYTYQDDKGNLTGFDIEILKEIEKRNPDLHFEFKLMSVSAGFLGLESKQVDLIANQITFNEQRAAKSIYKKEINCYTASRLAVRADRDDIKTLDDLKGKTVAVVSTSELTRELQKFNKEKNANINFVITDKGTSELMNMVATGRADAAPVGEVTIVDAAKTLGLKIKPAGPLILSVPTHYALRKDADSQKLADRLDQEVKKLREDGTLKKLSEKFLGKDYTVKQK